MKLKDFLSNNIKDEPKMLLHIGVGPRPHNEAKIFAALWPDIEIVGFEPDLGVFLNRHKDYPGTLYPLGVWRTNCLKQMSIASKHPGKSTLLEPHEDWPGKKRYNKTIIVSCISLDSLDVIMEFPRDIFLWMDIEGSELEALKGAKKILQSGRIKWIEMEIGNVPRRVGEPSEKAISSFLKPYKFVIKAKKTGKAFNDVLYVREK